MSQPNCWIVGMVLVLECGLSWEFCGVFSSEEAAVAACKDERYFVGPAVMDVELPDETIEWTGSYYPKAVVQ